MKRRNFIAAASVVAGMPLAAVAQLGTGARIGWIAGYRRQMSQPFVAAVRAGLSQHGYVEGRNFTIEERYPDDLQQVSVAVEELRRIPVDLFVTQGAATRGVIENAGPIPVVYVFSADPIEYGLAQSLARPTVNATGITLMMFDLAGKRLELLHEILPGLRRVAIVASPDHRGEARERQNAIAVANQLGIEIQYLPARSRAELDGRLSELASGGAEAVDVYPDPVTTGNRELIIGVATARGIPVISGWAMFAESGALCTYGPRLSDSYQRTAYYIDRILKGAKPAELPIEQPTVFDLVINMKTAKTLGIAIPLAILARSDQVIE